MMFEKFIKIYFSIFTIYLKNFLKIIIESIIDILPTKRIKLSEKNLIFIAGIEGSGTTLLDKLLSEPKNSISITHSDYLKLEISRLKGKVAKNHNMSLIQYYQYIFTAKKFNRLVNKIWQFPYISNHYKKNQILRHLGNLKIQESINNIVIKRSFPSGKEGIIFPNLDDLFSISKNIKIIHIKRSLKENASSILRRKFVSTIEDAITRVKKADRLIESQLIHVKKSEVLTVEYRNLIENKYYVLDKLEKFLGLKIGIG